MTHYRCQRVIPKLTRSMMISYTTYFRHHHIKQPSVAPEYRLLHGLQQFTVALQGAPSSQSGDQIHVLQYMQDTLNKWAVDITPKYLIAPQPSEKEKWDDRLPPRVQPPVPRVQNPANIERPQAPRVLVPRPDMPSHPVAHRTCARHKPSPPAAPPKVPPMAPPTVPEHPLDHFTRSRALTVNPSQADNRNYPSKLLELWCTPAPQVLESLPVLDEE